MKIFAIILLITLAITGVAVGFVFGAFTPDTPTHEHAFGEWEIRTPATCTEAGEEVRKCECNEEETREIAANGHSFGEWETKTPASCTAEGEEIRKCACGAEESRPVAKLDHTYGEWETKTPATCTAEGEEIRKCACGAEESRPVAKLDHTYGEWETKTPANCTDAEVEVRKCACGAEETREGEAATGHSFGAWQTRTEPTCDDAGVEFRACACGAEETNVLAATGHTFGEWATKTPATCTAEGEEIRKCTCGAEESRPVAKLDHTYGEWATKTPATCTDAEVEYRVCSCGAEETRTGDAATGHTAASIAAALTKTDAMKHDVLVAGDFAVTATCGCGASYSVSEGITLENATLTVEGSNLVTVKLGELSCDVTVNAAKFVKVVNGVVVDDTYVRSGSSYKDNNYADSEELYAYGDGTSRVLFRINFSDVINSEYYQTFKSEATVKVSFVLTAGSVSDTTKYTFKIYPVTEGRLNADFADLMWSNYNNDTYLFGWGSANDLIKKTETHNSSVDGNVITLTFTYREIEDFIDAESGNAIFVFAIWASGTKIGSIENTTEANRPTVQVVFSEDHAHAYIEQVAEEKYLASANCEEKAKYYYSCSCGEAGTATFEHGEVIEHSFGEWETKTPADCLNAEVEYRVCACSAEETREGDAALGHDMQTKFDETNHWTECSRCDEATEAVAHFGGTATETEQATCEGCEQKYGGPASHVHQFGDWQTRTEATCLEAEVEFRKCSCGAEETQTGDPALGHDMQTKFDETNHWTECSRCDEATDPVAHFGGEATETEKAICEDCGQSYGELKPVEKKEYSIAGSLVYDTDINSSTKDKDRSGNTQIYLYSSATRGFVTISIKDILNSEDFELFKNEGKFRITFTIAGNEADVNNTKFVLQIADPTYTAADGTTQYTASIPAGKITWNSAHTASGAYYDALYLGNMTYLVGNADSGKSLEQTNKVIYTEGADGAAGTITYELSYDDIKDYICMDQSSEYFGQVVFKLRAKGTGSAASKTLYYASCETATPPTVNFVYEK